MYHADVYDSSSASASYWADESEPLASPSAAERSAGFTYDVAVIGGGYTGLSTAYHLVASSNASVCVLEAGKIGEGASGLNGGFCNVSPSGGAGAICKRFGESQARLMIERLYEGVDLVRSLLREESIDAQPQFGGTYEVAHSAAAFDRLAGKADLLRGRLGVESELLSHDKFAEIGHQSPEQFGALHNPKAFTLNPLRYVRGLAQGAARKGADIFENHLVERLEKNEGVHELHTGGTAIRARRLVVATNAYTRARLHPQFTGRLMPVISHIVTTRPLTADEIGSQGWVTKLGCASTHATLFYYRLLPDGRLMFGGPGDTTGRREDAERTKNELHQAIGRRFPAWRDVELTHSWRGLVCTSRKFALSVGRADGDPTVLYGLGYHGNGIAAATWTGKQLASVAAESSTLEEAFPPAMLGLAGKFPLPALRPLYLRAALQLMRLRD